MRLNRRTCQLNWAPASSVNTVFSSRAPDRFILVVREPAAPGAQSQLQVVVRLNAKTGDQKPADPSIEEVARIDHRQICPETSYHAASNHGAHQPSRLGVRIPARAR